MKKVVSFFLLFILLIGMFPVVSYAGTTNVADGEEKSVFIQAGAELGSSNIYNLGTGSTLALTGQGNSPCTVRIALNITKDNVTVKLNNIKWDMSDSSLGTSTCPITVAEGVKGTKLIIEHDSQLIGLNGCMSSSDFCLSGVALKVLGELEIQCPDEVNFSIKGGNSSHTKVTTNTVAMGSCGIYVGSLGSLTFSGKGNIEVIGGKGPGGYDTPYVTTDNQLSSGGTGGIGGQGIYSEGIVKVSMISDSSDKGVLKVTGGTGGIGGRGEKATLCSHSKSGTGKCINVIYTSGGSGGIGGTSGTAYFGSSVAKLTVNSGMVSFEAGLRGEGGPGGYANCTAPIVSGGVVTCDGNHSSEGQTGKSGPDSGFGILGGNLTLNGGNLFGLCGCYDSGKNYSNGNRIGISVDKMTVNGGAFFSDNKLKTGSGLNYSATALTNSGNLWILPVQVEIQNRDSDYYISSVEIINDSDETVYSYGTPSWYQTSMNSYNLMMPNKYLGEDYRVKVLLRDEDGEDHYLISSFLPSDDFYLIFVSKEDLLSELVEEEPYDPGYAVTTVSFTGHASEAYSLTVPSYLDAGGEPLQVLLQGNWSSKRNVRVSVPETLELINTEDSLESIQVPVYFETMDICGNNKTPGSYTSNVSVGTPADPVFGTWSGTLIFTIEAYDHE